MAIDEKLIADHEERELLKTRADQLGITYSKNIPTEDLRRKVNDAIEAGNVTKEAKDNINKQREKQRLEVTKLIRCRISCLNPIKANYPGQIYCVGNDLIGMYKKYIPFNPRFYENGYHVPKIILDYLKELKYPFTYEKTLSNGSKKTVIEMKPEFSIEELPPLTKEELAKLADDQRRTGRVEAEE